MKRVKLLCIIALICTTVQLTWAQVPLATWSFNSNAGWGPGTFSPSTSNASVTIAGLNRGSGLDTGTTTAATNAWGAVDFNDGITSASQTSATAITQGNYVTYSVTPNAGISVSFSSISPYNVRRSSTGPGTMLWQYSFDGSTFTDIGVQIPTGSTSSSGNDKPAIDLSSISELQNVSSGTTVTFRLVLWNATADGGTWYFYSGGSTVANRNLIINGTLNSTPLPLTLMSFKGESENKANLLNWVTANEENVAVFELERGTNGYSFDKIATLNAKGNSTTANNHYTYQDVNAAATAYYRLNMVDRDGKANYSDIIVLRKGTVNSTISVFPNPAESTLFLKGLANNSSYRVTNAMGRAVISGTAVHAESTPVSIDISALVPGIYFLQLTDDNAIETMRFVKK
jgi:hypothetical protein